MRSTLGDLGLAFGELTEAGFVSVTTNEEDLGVLLEVTSEGDVSTIVLLTLVISAEGLVS